ncbi:mas-related G-protein coupled receptor member H-like [Lacerta agilis]|uniref:mas-related G-protein coupled receptor member H-like n=1 Tax=Lacerta agilis TaxID=80427 RepID=UPI00141A088C|nr:mas-related G-protein coupled receptor member H-like [Lacerta agilis]
MMVNSSWTSRSDMEAWAGYEHDNSSYTGRENDWYYPLKEAIFYMFSLVICCAGFLGNGTTIWLLSFCTKKNQFTTYILNLAVADFAFLMTVEVYHCIDLTGLGKDASLITLHLLMFTYNTDLLLLTAISIDRCVSVLFPIWHRCHRPTHLSTTVCSLIWVLCFLFTTILYIIQLFSIFSYYFTASFQLLLSALLCLALMTISTVILFIKVCFKSHQQKRGRLLMVLLLTLLFFLVLAFPLDALMALNHFLAFDIPDLHHYAFLCATLNSSVNPLIYFLVGRKKRGRSKESLQVILQRALNVEEDNGQEMDRPISNPLMILT